MKSSFYNLKMNFAGTVSLLQTVPTFIGQKLESFGFDMKGNVTKTETFSTNDDNIPVILTKKLYELQKSGEQCDYEIKTECGSSFLVHKWVISTVSLFFDRLFDNNFSDSKSNSITLPYLSADILEKIIEYMYTGNANILPDIAMKTMDGALFLGLPKLIDHCSKILIETLNDGNCLELLKYSETCVHFGTELTKKSLKLICKDFKKFVKMPYFCDLSSETMKILVEQDKISYREEDLYLAVRKWIAHDLKNRESFITSLIGKIQFENFSHQFAQSCIIHNNPLMESSNFKDLLIKNMDSLWKSKIQIENEKKNLYKINDRNIILYDFCKQDFSKVIAKICFNSDRYGYTTFGEDKIFICNSNNTRCEYFSIQENKWHCVPDKELKFVSKVIYLNENIYVFGISSDESKREDASYEILDVNYLSWSHKNNFKVLDHNRFDVANTNNCFYIVEKGQVQRLDLRTSRWDTIYKKLDDKRYFNSVQMYAEKIYSFDEEGIKVFDIRRNSWLDSYELYKEKYVGIPTTCIMNDKIYILGNSYMSKYCLQIFNLPSLSLNSCNFMSNNYGQHNLIFSL